MNEFVVLDAVAQAQLVRDGKVNSVELVEAAIARIEAFNGQLNAVITPTFELAGKLPANRFPTGPCVVSRSC